MSRVTDLKLDRLSKELSERIIEDQQNNVTFDFACRDYECCRRNDNKDRASIIRPAFVRDCEKILHSNYYGRYADKTQVFSFYRNDDITRRAQHIQLVSRIARNIGRVLRLNVDLIEAIALGHDIGHTPFGHAGERFLNDLYKEHTGRFFRHNVHSVRVLDQLVPLNLSLQTLDGILAHNGELELKEYRPKPCPTFAEFDNIVEQCNCDIKYNLQLIPCTMEGCVVRISDIIAYLGKDRQDALRTKRIDRIGIFADTPIGNTNAEIINNLTVNIIENSYGKPYIKMDSRYFSALQKAKHQNGELIYRNENDEYANTVFPMMRKLYEKLRDDVIKGNVKSPIYDHHIALIESSFYRKLPYRDESPDQIVMDYIASMTDDYFIDLFEELFPDDTVKICFKGYF